MNAKQRALARMLDAGEAELEHSKECWVAVQAGERPEGLTREDLALMDKLRAQYEHARADYDYLLEAKL